MKLLLILASCILIEGCAQQAVVPVEPPGMFKLAETDELTTYFAVRSISLYEGNPNLRQFYTIINYKNPTKITGLQPVHSSHAIEVVNCERKEMTRIDRVYFSKPFAMGTAVFKASQMAPKIPQWTPIPKNSINGSITDFVCSLDASRISFVQKAEALEK